MDNQRKMIRASFPKVVVTMIIQGSGEKGIP